MTDDPELNARNSDPNTSHAAAKTIKLKDRATVWELYLEFDPHDLADFKMEAQLGGPMNGKWRKRRSDLVRDGLLIAVREVMNPHTGMMVKSWGVNHARKQPPPKEQLVLI